MGMVEAGAGGRSGSLGLVRRGPGMVAVVVGVGRDTEFSTRGAEMSVDWMTRSRKGEQK